MRLLSAPPSPFGRKVKIVAHMKGLMDRIGIEHTDTRDPANATLRQANPLGKIPVLILADGTRLYDSHVICEYLDSLAPSPVLFAPAGLDRYLALTRAALADGIMEAGVLMVYEERFREPQQRSASWVMRQQSKVDAGLAALEAAAARGELAWGANPTYDHVSIGCALGYLDLRFGGQWRGGHPHLVSWLDRFAVAVPGFGATVAVA